MREVWYRVEATQYAAPLDEFDNPSRFPGSVEARIVEYEVLSHTPKGVWLATGICWTEQQHTSRTFVRRDARKRFAAPTKAEAFESFFARKKRRMSILEAQIAKEKRLVAAAERLRAKECPAKQEEANEAI